MAWGLEARVPFLDKAFLEVAMNVDAKEKMFNKGTLTEFDEDGKPRMEKVSSVVISLRRDLIKIPVVYPSQSV